MSAPPPLFDLSIRAKRRARRRDTASFLHAEAIDMLKERLQEVNRTFRSKIIVNPGVDLWAENFPDGAIVEDNEILDVAGEFDLALHGLSLHAHNDPVGQLVQLRHALKPDGMLIAVMFGGQTLHELRSSLAEAEIAVRGGLSPRVAPMGEIRDLGGLIGRAGFALPVADSISLTVTYETPLHLMRELRDMGETNVMVAQDRGMLRRDVLAHACEIYTQAFSDGDRVRATFELVFLTGWAPGDGQQKPLRPGSASARLADALKTVELPAGEKPDGN